MIVFIFVVVVAFLESMHVRFSMFYGFFSATLTQIQFGFNHNNDKSTIFNHGKPTQKGKKPGALVELVLVERSIADFMVALCD